MSISYTLQALDLWFQSPPGSMLFAHERRVLSPLLASMPGDFLVQIGGRRNLSLCSASPIRTKVLCLMEAVNHQAQDCVQADFEHLPLQPNSVDVMVLAHALEYLEDPQALLAETYQALRPGGHIIITHFNPYSLLGLQRVTHLKRGLPWSGEFRPLVKLQTWLGGIGYNLQHIKSSFYKPLFNSEKLLQTLNLLEGFNKLMPQQGGIYVIVASKQSNIMATVSKAWRTETVVATNMHFR